VNIETDPAPDAIGNAFDLGDDRIVLDLAPRVPRKLDFTRLGEFEECRVKIEDLRGIEQRKQRRGDAVNSSHGAGYGFAARLRQSNTTVAEKCAMLEKWSNTQSSHARKRAGQS